MISWRGFILATGLLLLTLGTVIVGNKMRGSSAPAVAVAPTQTPVLGRVPGFSDDPLIVLCKPDENKVTIYRQVKTGFSFLYSFDMSAVLEAAPQPISAQVDSKVTLTLTKERLGRLFLTFQQQDDPQQVSYFGKYFTC